MTFYLAIVDVDGKNNGIDTIDSTEVIKSCLGVTAQYFAVLINLQSKECHSKTGLPG